MEEMAGRLINNKNTKSTNETILLRTYDLALLKHIRTEIIY